MRVRLSLAALLLCGLASQTAGAQTSRLLRPFLHAASQDGSVFLSWSEVPGAKYAIQWRRADRRAEWETREVGDELYAAVDSMPNGEWGEFRVLAVRETGVDTSDIIPALAQKRTDCGDWAERVFCAIPDLKRYLDENNLDETRLVCAGHPVIELTSSSPNCQYQLPGSTELLALDRDFSNSFRPPARAPSNAVVRAIARRALWGESDPFKEPSLNGRLVSSQYASVGGVRGALSAHSFSIRVTAALQSRLTWFVPEHPTPGRYAIYHEGHELPGGGAVKSASEVIDWLLERGWQVVAMDMLLNGENEIDKTYALQKHDDLIQQVDAGTVDPFTLMLDPIKVVVDSIYDQAMASGRKPVVLLAGRSGGGLLADVYSAVDERIDVAVEIAGMSPASTQLDSTLYAAIVNEFDITIPRLYSQIPSAIVQTSGGRLGSFHFYSVRDPCCFRFRPESPFVNYLQTLTTATKGRVRVYVGNQPMHGVDAAALTVLGRYLTDIGLGPVPVFGAETNADVTTRGVPPSL